MVIHYKEQYNKGPCIMWLPILFAIIRILFHIKWISCLSFFNFKVWRNGLVFIFQKSYVEVNEGGNFQIYSTREFFRNSNFEIQDYYMLPSRSGWQNPYSMRTETTFCDDLLYSIKPRNSGNTYTKYRSNTTT